MNTYKYSLKVTEGAIQGTRYPVMAGGSTLGRSSQCEISIQDMLLSRSHCRFEIRNGELWVIDLASANQTLVNQAPVDEKALAPGDIIQVGDTTLQVERERTGDSESDTATTPDAAVVIDLGFGHESAAPSSKRSLLRPVIWIFGAILILVAGVTLILDPDNRKQSATKMRSIDKDLNKTLLISYEKVEASADNIFRYELNLSPAGMLAVKIDDLSGKNRHVRKEKRLAPDLMGDLVNDIEGSGFFALDKSYTGFAARPNELNEMTITVVVGVKAHTCRVTNRQEPEGFRALREKLETFSKNELGIWAIQFSTEKLTELAQNALGVARKKYDEREVRFNNLYESMRSYQEAVFYLDTVNPKPDFYEEIISGFETAESELNKRYEEHRFQANRAINLKEWPDAARELKILREIIPDPSDSRHKEASRTLLDVEARLKKIKR